MPIMIEPYARKSLTELDHVRQVPICSDTARVLIQSLALSSDPVTSEVVWTGKIWDHDDIEDVDYPSSPIDLRVRGGNCVVVTNAVFGVPLLDAWIRELMLQPMIIQIRA